MHQRSRQSDARKWDCPTFRNFSPVSHTKLLSSSVRHLKFQRAELSPAFLATHFFVFPRDKLAFCSQKFFLLKREFFPFRKENFSWCICKILEALFWFWMKRGLSKEFRWLCMLSSRAVVSSCCVAMSWRIFLIFLKEIFFGCCFLDLSDGVLEEWHWSHGTAAGRHRRPVCCWPVWTLLPTPRTGTLWPVHRRDQSHPGMLPGCRVEICSGKNVAHVIESDRGVFKPSAICIDWLIIHLLFSLNSFINIEINCKIQNFPNKACRWPLCRTMMTVQYYSCNVWLCASFSAGDGSRRFGRLLQL